MHTYIYTNFYIYTYISVFIALTVQKVFDNIWFSYFLIFKFFKVWESFLTFRLFRSSEHNYLHLVKIPKKFTKSNFYCVLSQSTLSLKTNNFIYFSINSTEEVFPYPIEYCFILES